jgi:hypothetical protein
VNPRRPAGGLASLLAGLSLTACGGVELDFAPLDGSADGIDAFVDGGPVDAPTHPQPDGTSPPDAPTFCNNPQVCGCNSDPDCRNNNNGNHSCDQASHQCVDCVHNNDCNSSRCVDFQCVRQCDVNFPDAGQCGASFHCGPGDFCIQCESMDDCRGDPSQPVCNPINGRCVECVGAMDCAGSGMACSLTGRCFNNFGPGGGGG